MLIPVDTCVIDTFGYYDFFQITTGNYIVKAELSSVSANYSQFYPTYFGEVLTWGTASNIILISNIYNGDIILKNVSGTNPGIGNIYGNVLYGENKLLPKGTPAENVEIILMDVNRDPLSFKYSNSSGLFDFSNIALGTYCLYAEVTGKYTIPIIFTINDNHPNAQVDIIINTDSVTVSIEDDLQKYKINIGEVYPNPVSDVANLTFSLTRQTEFQVIVFNKFGQLIFSFEKNYHQGVHKFELNTSNFPYGVFYLQISTSGGVKVVRKFIKLN